MIRMTSKSISTIFIIIAVIVISTTILSYATTDTSGEDALFDIHADIREQIERLSSSKAHERAKGAHELNKIGKRAKPAVPYLLNLLGDNSSLTAFGVWCGTGGIPKTTVSQEAVKALAAIGEKSVTSHIIALIKRDSYNKQRHSDVLFNALKMLDPDWQDSEEGKELILEFVKDLIGDNWMYRSKALSALDKTNWEPGSQSEKILYFILKGKWRELTAIGEPAIEPLISTLVHNRSQDDVIRTLDKIDPGWKESEVARKHIDELAGSIKDIESKNTFSASVFTLAKLKDKRAIEHLVTLLSEPRHRYDALNELQRLSWEPESITEKIKVMIANEEWDSIIKIGEAGLRQLIIERGNNRNNVVLNSLIRIDPDWKKSKASRKLADEYIAGLNKDDSSLSNMIRVLKDIGDDRAIEPLVAILKEKALMESSYNKLRYIIADTLKDLGWKPENSEERIKYLIAHTPAFKLDKLEDIGEPEREQIAKIIKMTKDDYLKNKLEELLKGTKDEKSPKKDKSIDELVKTKSVSALIIKLKDEDSYNRRSAADALVKIGEEAYEQLIAALSDENHYIRRYASYALGKKGVEAAEDRLITLLKDKDSLVKMHAVIALGSIKAKNAAKPLIGLIKDKDPSIRKSVYNALGNVGTAETVGPLIDAIDDEEPDMRMPIYKALSKIGDVRAFETFIKALEENKPVIILLGELGDKRAIVPLLPLLKDEESSVRSNAAEALNKLGWEPSNQSEEITYLIASNNWYQLKGLGEPVVEPLIALLDDKSNGVRSNTIKTLGTIGDKRAVEPLIKALKKDEYREARLNAAQALGEINDTRAVEALIEALNDDYKYVVEYAAKALANLGDKRAVEPLLKILKKEGSYNHKVVEALGMLGDKRAVEPLISAIMFKTSDSYAPRKPPQASRYVLNALGMLRDKQAIKPLIPILIIGDLSSQGNAFSALRNIDENWAKSKEAKEAIPEFVAALDHDNKIIRRGASRALKKIGWKPSNQSEEVKYKIAKLTSRNWNIIVNLGKPAVEPLIDMFKDNRSYSGIIFNWSSAAVGITAMIGKPAVPHLVKALDDDNITTRYQAARALGKIAEKENIDDQALDPLIKALGDIDYRIQANAAKTLGIMKNKKAVEPLIAFLKEYDRPSDNRYSDRSYAISSAYEALGRIGDKRAVGQLKESINKGYIGKDSAAKALREIDPSKSIEPLIAALTSAESKSAVAAEELGKLGDPRAVGPLISVLDNGNETLRNSAALALVKIGDPRAVEPLAALLSVEDKYGRMNKRAIIIALGEMGDSRAVGALIKVLENAYYRKEVIIALGNIGGKQVIEPLKAMLKSQSRDYLLEATVQGLVNLGWEPENVEEKIIFLLARNKWDEIDEAGEGFVEPLIKMLADGSYSKVQIAKALKQIGDPRAIEPLIAALDDNDRYVREDLEKALVVIEGEHKSEALIKAFKENKFKEKYARGSLAYVLGRMKSKDAVEPLIAALKEDDPSERKIVTALGDIGDPRAIDAIIPYLRGSYGAIQMAAIEALVKLKDPRAGKHIVPLLKSGATDSVTLTAMKALGELKAPSAVEPLYKMLTYKYWYSYNNRSHDAARALAKIGNKNAVKHLILALENSNKYLRISITKALTEITGLNFGNDHKKWQSWWEENHEQYERKQ